jgi:hypothetical protein
MEGAHVGALELLRKSANPLQMHGENRWRIFALGVRSRIVMTCP